MNTIKNVHARQILDSRGNPTIEVEVCTDQGFMGRAAIPSGASVGAYEAIELRDQDSSVYLGKSIHQAIKHVKEIVGPSIIGRSVFDQRAIDEWMINLDGTPNKARLGANAILGVSIATAKAAANSLGIHVYQYLGGLNAHILPTPMINVLNGGAHADNNLDIQEFMLVPFNAPSFAEALRISSSWLYFTKKWSFYQCGR